MDSLLQLASGRDAHYLRYFSPWLRTYYCDDCGANTCADFSDDDGEDGNGACCWTVATLALAAEDYLLLVEGYGCERGAYAFTVGCAEPGFETGYGYGEDDNDYDDGEEDDAAPVGGGMGLCVAVCQLLKRETGT